jgi:hypothetical protein
VDIKKLERWAKYEEKIDNFVAMKEINDETLFNAIRENSKLVQGHAETVKYFAEKGSLVAIEETAPLLKKAIEHLQLLITEAKERAYASID